MVRIPAGEFSMGSQTGEGAPNERPRHRVRLDAFCMDRTTVTVAAYQGCVSAGACQPAPTTANYPGITEEIRRVDSHACNGSRDDRADHPVNCVDWHAAEAYCRWRGARLPSEAEWEYAARGSDGRIYPWGDTPPGPTLLNACGRECAMMLRRIGVTSRTMYPADDGWPSTAPVGRFRAGDSPFGLQDMAGNVWEWTADWYGPYPTGAEIPVENPRGPSSGTARVARGSDWGRYLPTTIRAAHRVSDLPTSRSGGTGFRCASDLPVR
jgi:formylglycine-generating enzyme required for sulfatase activity